MLIDAWFPFYGGGQVHVKNLSQQLIDKYHYRVSIFYPRQSDLAYRIIWCFTVVPKVLLLPPVARPQLIHSHGFLPGIPAKIISLLLHIPVVHTVHGSHLMDLGETGFKAVLEKYILTKIKYSGQITVSQSFLKYPNINKNIVVIRNGVNRTEFDQVRVNKSAHPTIICVARNHPHKGLTYLRQAYRHLQPTYPQLKLNVISTGLHGTKLIAAYKRAHIFVLPSLAEGQPISILEAWAAKLPVIATKVGDNPYLITVGKTGILINPAQPQQLVDAITSLLTHPQTSKRLASNGYDLVKRHYTWDKVAAATHSFYLHLLQ